MNKSSEALLAWFENIAREGRENPSPHRRKICQNYLEHAALEYSIDRWQEIFTPQRTVEHPRYEIKWGTPETVVYDGAEAVQGFYTALTDGGAMSTQDELLAVADWGFCSFLTINLYRTAEQAVLEGWVQTPETSATRYVIETRAAMYWRYDEDARLIGEHVFEMEGNKVRPAEDDEWLTAEDVAQLVKPYLPHGPEIGSSDAFRNVPA